MNLRDLRYLVALSEFKHFGRAAEASFISQPTLSAQIRKLEEELGVALVERLPRNVLLTDVGGEIAKRARLILNEVDQIKMLAKRAHDPESGTLRLGVFPTLAPYWLPHVVPEIKRRFPQLELLLVEEKTDVLLQQLREGTLDAAALALPVHDEQLHSEFLFEEPFLLAVPKQHAFTKRKKPFTLEDLSGETLLLLEDGHCLRDQALDVCQLAGAREKSGFRATSLETLRLMVATDVGITLLPALSVKPPILPVKNIELIEFAAEKPSRRVALVWRKSSAIGEFLQKFVQLFRALTKDVLSS